MRSLIACYENKKESVSVWKESNSQFIVSYSIKNRPHDPKADIRKASLSEALHVFGDIVLSCDGNEAISTDQSVS